MRVAQLAMGVLLALGAFSTTEVLAQAKLANRPIRLLVPFAPGGGVDVVARIVGQKVSEQIGQPVLVESKPGAGGALAVNELMRAEADGTTLLATTSSHATLPLLSKLPWHPSNDFTPVAGIYSTMMVMPTNAASTSKFKTLAEFVAYVRANPGKINWGSSGIAGPQHLIGAQFAKAAKLDMVHVPYRGNNPMLQALLQNDVQLTFDTPTLAMPQINDGRLVALAVTGERRMAKLPNVPTVKEAGIDYTAGVQIFVLGPKGISDPVAALLNKEFVTALDNKEVRERLTGFGLEVAEGRDNTPAHLKKHIDYFATTYGRLINEMGIKAE
ncbi:MAG: tripartite tricarboxylate transporter substrate binding protein [Xanthobacteraceae bacterium]|nr:tripartite tricarboxylate transporter substrate binding protein [Xanthobacteraceae bacterium]